MIWWSTTAMPGRTRRALVADGLLGLFLVAPLVLSGSASVGETAATVAVIAASVATSRALPTLSLLFAAGISLLNLIVGFGTLGPWPVVAMAVLGGLAGRRSVGSGSALAVFAGVAAAGLPLAFATSDGWTWLLMLVVELAAVLPWWLGRYLRLRANMAEAGWVRAQGLQREQRVVAEQARLRERARIARDMHDSLGHRLSLIALQAGALELKTGLNESTQVAVAQLRVSTVDATNLLHEIIGLLREVSEPAPRQPADETVDALVERVRAAGALVTLHRDGEPADLPSRIDRAVYRVVQESLTNAVKHAPGSPVSVRLTYRPEQTEVQVDNTLPSATQQASPGGGRGLIGLHERVRLAGGTLRAGTRDGRFSVLARLPSAPTPVESPQPERVPGWSAPADELRQAKRHMGRDLRSAAVLPAALVVGLAVVFLGLRTYTTTSTALDPAAYNRMRMGQTEAELDPSLPSARMTKTLPIVPEPAVPADATCAYYRTTANPFSLSNDLYRLCFRDDVLVSKDLLIENP